MNVHLPWDSVLIREHQIIKIVNAVDKKTYDYVYMAGDFNCSDFSDVQRFLLGECTLNNCESLPCWFDLASAYAEITDKEAEDTLDFAVILDLKEIRWRQIQDLTEFYCKIHTRSNFQF